MAFEDHYQRMGIPPTATALQIRKAYRGLVLKYHPDRNPEDPAAEELFKKIGVAYRILSDPAQRADYDARYPLFRPSSGRRPAPKENDAEKRRRKEQAEARRARARARAAYAAAAATPFDHEANEFEQRDFLRGLSMGAMATVWFVALRTSDLKVSLWIALLGSFLPWLGCPLGYRAGEWLGSILERAVGSFSDAVHVVEVVTRFFPVAGALCGASGAISVAHRFGLSLPDIGLVDATLAAGVAGMIGGAFGRAFTSVARRFLSRAFGIGVGAAVGAITGGIFGLTAALFYRDTAFQANALLNAIVAGALGGALAAAVGSFGGRGTARESPRDRRH